MKHEVYYPEYDDDDEDIDLNEAGCVIYSETENTSTD